MLFCVTFFGSFGWGARAVSGAPTEGTAGAVLTTGNYLRGGSGYKRRVFSDCGSRQLQRAAGAMESRVHARAAGTAHASRPWRGAARTTHSRICGGSFKFPSGRDWPEWVAGERRGGGYGESAPTVCATGGAATEDLYRGRVGRGTDHG